MNLNNSLEKIAYALEHKVGLSNTNIDGVTPMSRIANALMKKYNLTLPEYLNDLDKVVMCLSAPVSGPIIEITTNGTYDITDYTQATVTVYEDVKSITNAQIDALFS